MNLQFGDIQETALIPLAIKASETARPNARIKDLKAKEIIDALGVDVSKFDPFLSHEGVVARTILYREQLKTLLKQKKQSSLAAGSVLIPRCVLLKQEKKSSSVFHLIGYSRRRMLHLYKSMELLICHGIRQSHHIWQEKTDWSLIT